MSRTFYNSGAIHRERGAQLSHCIPRERETFILHVRVIRIPCDKYTKNKNKKIKDTRTLQG